MLAASLAALALATGHFFLRELPGDPAVGSVIFSPIGVPITLGLLLAMALTAACFVSAGLLRTGKPVFDRDSEDFIVCALALAGVAIYGFRTVVELPPVAATWWWLALIWLAGGLSVWRRSPTLVRVVIAMMFIVAAKWVFYDTLGRRLAFEGQEQTWVVFNWQLALGLATAGTMLLLLRQWTKLGLARSVNGLPAAETVANNAAPAGPAVPHGGIAAAGIISSQLNHFIVVLAAGLVVWGGSFEVDRYFNTAKTLAFVGPGQEAMARQMGYCLWWALYALAALATGLAVRRAPLRWFAIILLGITTGLIVVMILYYAQSIYRIVALAGVSVLALAAAWLYNRYFKTPAPR